MTISTENEEFDTLEKNHVLGTRSLSSRRRLILEHFLKNKEAIYYIIKFIRVAQGKTKIRVEHISYISEYAVLNFFFNFKLNFSI